MTTSPEPQAHQDGPQLQPGSRVRFWSPALQQRAGAPENDPLIAVVDEVRKDEIIVRIEGWAYAVRAPFTDLDRLELSQEPRRNNTLKYALFGGLGLGLALGIVATGESRGTDWNAGPAGFVLGGLVGAIVGGIVGHATSSPEVWEEVPLDSLGVILVPDGAIQFTVSFGF